MYEYIAGCVIYDEAISELNELYINPSDEIFALHKLIIKKQTSGEPFDEFLQSLRNLAKDSNFKFVNAESYCEKSSRDVFTSGLQSDLIRQRLLEYRSLTAKNCIRLSKNFRISTKKLRRRGKKCYTSVLC